MTRLYDLFSGTQIWFKFVDELSQLCRRLTLLACSLVVIAVLCGSNQGHTSFGGTVPPHIDEIQQLLQRLHESPDKNAVDRAVQLIIGNQAKGRESDLETAVRSLLESDEYKGLVLDTLSRLRAPFFDIDIASLIPGSISEIDMSKLQHVFAAAQRSGSQASFSRLKMLATSKQPQFDASKSNDKNREFIHLRAQVWQIAFAVNPVETANAALLFYAHDPAGKQELDEDTFVSDMLVRFVTTVESDSRTRLQLNDSLQSFIGPSGLVFGPGLPTTPQNAENSTTRPGRYKVLRSIALLMANNKAPSPVVLSTLLRFADSPYEDLQKIALDANYTVLERESWLLPIDSYIFATSPSSNASRILSKLSVSLPVGQTFVDDLKWKLLRNLRNLGIHGALESNESQSANRERAISKQNDLMRSTLEYLSHSYEIDTKDVNVDVDPKKFPHDFDPSTFQPFVPSGQQPPYPYLSMFVAKEGLGAGLQKALIKSGQNLDDAAKLSRYLVQREFERRSLVLYSILAARRRMRDLNRPFDLISADDELDRLSSLPESPGTLVSTVVPNILTKLNSELTAQVPAGCTDLRMELLQRTYSFNQGLYQETLSVTCSTGYKAKFTWIGPIPITLLSALRRHPRVLDFPGVSLTMRELESERTNAPPVVEDIDLIRNNPIFSIPYLINAITDPSVAWQHVKDSLLVETRFCRPVKFLEATSVPFTSSPPLPPVDPSVSKKPYSLPPDEKRHLEEGLPGGVAMFSGIYIAESNESYDAAKDQFRKPFLYLISYRANRLIGERVKGAFEAIDVNKPCEAADVLCHIRCCGYPHKDKGKEKIRNTALTEIYTAIGNGKIYEDYLRSWDLDSIGDRQISKVVLRQMVIKPDMTEFLGTYEITTDTGVVRYVNLEGKLNPLPGWLRTIIAKDGSFLHRFNIDLGGASESENARLATAVQRTLNQDTGPLPALELLDRTGFYALSPPEPTLKPSIPLFHTVEGRIRAAELTTYSAIYDFASGSKFPDPGPPRPTFVEAIREIRKGAKKVIDDRVNQQSTEILKSLPQETNQWSVFFGFTVGGAPTPIYFGTISYNSIDINVSTSFSNSVLVAPGLNGQPLPIGVSIDLPASDSSSSARPFDTPSRSAYDAALASSPTRMAVAGTMYKPTRNLAFVSPVVGGPSPVSAAPGPVPFRAEIPTSWQFVPALPGSWKVGSSAETQVDRAFFAGILARADPKLSQEEFDSIWAAMKSGSVPESMIDLLIERGNQAIEEQNIENGTWIRTNADKENDLIPTSGASGKPLSTSERNALYSDFNSRSSENFETAKKKAREEFKTDAIFDDGMPAVTLTYGNNFSVWKWTYTYRLKSGAKIGFEFMEDTPFWLVDHVRRDPKGHVMEKLGTAATESMRDWAANPRSPIIRGEVQKFKEADLLKDQLKDVIDGSGTTVLQSLQNAINDYFERFNKWIRSQTGTSGVTEPFKPPTIESPMLNFFPSPYEWSERRDAAIDDILTHERDADVVCRARNGELNINPQQPILP